MHLLEDIKKPINIIFLIIALASIAISIYFYYSTKRFKSISYQVEQSSKIYDSILSRTDSVYMVEENPTYDANGNPNGRTSLFSPLKENVYLFKGKIWNSGNLTIEKNDLRRNLEINLKDSHKILSYKIVNGDSIEKFSFIKKGSNKLEINWLYFDPNYGFTFQIIYIGKENPGFELTGKILGIDHFEKAENENKAIILSSNYEFDILFITSIMSLITSILLIRRLSIIAAESRNRKRA